MGQSDEEDVEPESSSSEDCDSVLGLDFATLSSYEVGSSSQMMPMVEFGCLG